MLSANDGLVSVWNRKMEPTKIHWLPDWFPLIRWSVCWLILIGRRCFPCSSSTVNHCLMPALNIVQHVAITMWIWHCDIPTGHVLRSDTTQRGCDCCVIPVKVSTPHLRVISRANSYPYRLQSTQQLYLNLSQPWNSGLIFLWRYCSGVVNRVIRKVIQNSLKK